MYSFLVVNGEHKKAKCLNRNIIRTIRMYCWMIRCWIPNPGVLFSKLLGGSKVDSAFHPFKVDKMSTRHFWELSGKKYTAFSKWSKPWGSWTPSINIVWTPPPPLFLKGGSKFWLPPPERGGGIWKTKKGGGSMVRGRVFLKRGGTFLI